MILLPGCLCCCSGCQCGDTFTTDGSNSPQFSIVFSDSTSTTVCLNDMASFGPAPGDAPQVLKCGPGDDTEFPARRCVYYIVWLYGGCFFRIYFSLTNFPDCNCANGDSCDYLIEGWENYSGGCSRSITSIEITGVGIC